MNTKKEADSTLQPLLSRNGKTSALPLCILFLGILPLCETEESFYQPRFPANDVLLTRQALFKPENFACHTDSTLKSRDFRTTQSGRRKSISPLFSCWNTAILSLNFTWLEKRPASFCSPHCLDKPHCIDAIWLRCTSKTDGWSFFPLKRDDELIRESDQVFIFDLLSCLVFYEENAKWLIQASCPDLFAQLSPNAGMYISDPNNQLNTAIPIMLVILGGWCLYK